MNPALEYLAVRWPSAACLACALAAALLGGFLRKRRPGRGMGWLVLGGVLGLAGVGGLVLPAGWTWWVLVLAGALLAVMAVTLFLSGAWWGPLAYAAVGLALLGVG